MAADLVLPVIDVSVLTREPVGVGDPQSSARLEKPMSLLPIVIVTSAVSADRTSRCGGLGPGGDALGLR